MTDKIRQTKSQTLIIGAGPAGMATAMELHKANHRFTLVEKSDSVGGLSRTYQFGKFRTDNGPHRFFSKNPYLYEFIGDILGDDWIKVNRFTRFYIDGKFYMYPIQWKNVLANLGPTKITNVLTDYYLAKWQYRNKPLDNFEDYTIANFGKTLAELNMLNYTQKIWGLPCSQLSSDFAKQRIKGLSIGSLLKKILTPRSNTPTTLVDQFYYPRYGTGTIYEKIKDKISTTNDIILNDYPVKISHKNFHITQIKLKSGKTFRPRHLVSSIPITELVKLLDPAPPKKITTTTNKLRYRSQVYLFLTIDKPQISPDQWIYFPETSIPMGRISEMKNFSPEMSPPNQTSLFIEYFCWENDATWNASKEELLQQTIPYLQKFNFVQPQEIIDVYHLKAKNNYPVYELGYKQRLQTIQRYLDKFDNLIYIGRPGRFRWNNQDHSLEMGILAAQSIIDNKKYNIEAVGSELDYQESAKLTTS